MNASIYNHTNHKPTATTSAIVDNQQAHQLATLIEQYTASIDVKPTSQAHYKRTAELFFDWTATTGRQVDKLTEADIKAYKNDLEASGKSPLTIGSYINGVRCFYKWASKHNLCENIAADIKAPKKPNKIRKQPLTIEQCGDLLRHEAETSARDFALATLLLQTGLRTIEARRANIGDITYRGGKRVLLVWGKGHEDKDDFVLITDRTADAIDNYLQTRPKAKQNEPLFVSNSHHNQGGRLTTHSISRIVKTGLKAIGLNDKVYTAHSLRHTCGVNILRAGASLDTAQYTLRHVSPETTQIYVATLKEEQRLKKGGEYVIEDLFNQSFGEIEPTAIF